MTSPKSQSNVAEKLEIGKVKRPLTVKLPLIGFCFVLCITLASSLLFYFESRNLLIEQEMDELSLKVAVITPLINHLLKQAEQDVTFLSSIDATKNIIKHAYHESNIVIARDKDYVSRLITQRLDTFSYYKKISIFQLDDNVNVVFSALHIEDSVSVVPQANLAKNVTLEALAGVLDMNTSQVFFSNIEFNRQQYNNRLAYFYAAMPIFNESNKLVGMVVIDIDFSDYIDTLRKDILANISMYLADNQGRLISSYSNKPTQFDTFPIKDFEQRMFTNQFQIREYQHGENDSSLAYYSPITMPMFPNLSPLHLLLENRNELYLNRINEIKNDAVFLSLGLACLGFILTFYLSKKITKPLVEMTKYVRSFSQQQVKGLLPTLKQDELGVLARSFHNLVLTIEEQVERQRSLMVEAENTSLRLQAILNSIIDAVITIDEKGRILSFNKAAESMFGYTENEMFYENISVLMPEEYAHSHDGYLARYARNNVAHIIGIGRELPAVRKDGEIFPMHLSVSEVKTEHGAIYTGLIRDITEVKIIDAERKRMFTEAQNAVWRLNFALSAPKIGVWELELSTGHLHWDDRMYQLFDIDPAECQSARDALHKRVHSEDISSVERKLAQLSKEGQELHYSFRIVLDNGEEKYIESHAQVIFDANGIRSHIVGTNQDNTEQVQLQKLKQTALENAESSLRLKSEFLASMSHEIRTPMNGVLGMLGLLESSELSTQQMHYVSLALSSAQSLLTLINDILDFSKIEAGKLELELVDFDLRSQIGEFAESMAFKAEDKCIELILDLTHIEYSVVKGDPSRLRQILTNLVGNAIKFTNKGEIVISASVKEEGEGLMLYCDIKDTGIGIPPAKVPSLFDSFTQVDASTTRKYGGTGLGLAIVKQLCELMGGKVSVQSVEGKGSTFSFHISLAKSNKSKIVVPDIDISDKKILIVDDNKTNLEVLKGQLEQWGAIVIEATSGKEALSIVANADKGDFSAAILDGQMPEMDGAMLGKKLKQEPVSEDVPLIMMTSMNEFGDATYFNQLGFSAYFPKPATTADLINVLAIVMDDRSRLKESKIITQTQLLGMHRMSPEVNQPRQARIMVVEDNRINQVVLKGMLSNINLSADIAGNGEEALDLLKNCPDNARYELIIMDCQMPVLDGYKTTAAIRQGEAGDHYREIVIIAMTANAMKGDMEKCLAAGMNDYAAKPVDADLLQEKLCRWLGVEDQQIRYTGKTVKNNNEGDKTAHNQIDDEHFGDEVWAKTQFYARVRHNTKLAKKLIHLFLSEAPQLIHEINLAIKEQNLDKVQALAHKLKGSSFNLSANKLGNLAKAIESEVIDENLEKVNMHVESLIDEFEILCKQVNDK
ncbi:response regulator [Thalassotalea sediminis]|uniref:response regulator n=1 Tax=Thalassotalea sediminis TaxID=1759089 RepID=UPI0025727E78|nr:response regulator [Thalassotalea sediminis]